MVNRIQQRRDTAANWATINPVLYAGEPGYVTDTEDLKIGDGATPWNSLASWSPGTVRGASKQVVIGDNGYGSSLLANAASTAGTGEMMFTVGAAATTVTALWEHWYTQVATNPKTDTDPSGSITFSASLRVVSSSNPGTVTGTIYRLTFSGRITVTLDPGGKITADDLGLSLAVGDVVAIRTYLSTGTAYAPRRTWGDAGTSGPGGFTATTDLTAPGSTTIASSGGYYYGPSALLGKAAGAGNAKSVLLLGDSIAAGVGDYAVYTMPAVAQGGYLERALTGVAGSLNLAIGGDLASYFQSTDGSFRRLSNSYRCNSAIIEYGSNDLVNGSTAAALEAVQLNLASNIRRLGIAKVFITTIVPRTTSTDGWATTGNQTVLASESQRLAYNAWIRAKCPIDPTSLAPVAVGTSGALLSGSFGHPLTGIFDTASKVESALNSGFWLPTHRVATGSITSGQNILTSSTANFQTANQELGGDKGSTIMVLGAGASGALLQGNAATVSSSTQVLLNVLAGTTVSNVQINIGARTVDGVHPSADGHNLIVPAVVVASL